MSTMSYKGYAATVQYDDEDGLFFGRVAGIRDGVGFHGETVSELRTAFHDAVGLRRQARPRRRAHPGRRLSGHPSAKVGKSPQKPYSGNVMFRISPKPTPTSLWRPSYPARAGLNQWAAEKLTAAALAEVG